MHTAACRGEDGGCVSIKNRAAGGAKAVPCNDLFTLDYRAQAESQEAQLFLFVLTSVQPSSDTERGPAVSRMSHKGQILFLFWHRTQKLSCRKFGFCKG